MSASVGVYVATALFLAIGGDSEELMRDGAQVVERRLVQPMRGPERSWREQWGSKPDCPILLPPPKEQPNTKNCVPWGKTGVKVLTRPEWLTDGRVWRLQL